MKTATVILVAGFLFVSSDAFTWLTNHTPDWVGGLLLLVGLPWLALKAFSIIIKLAKEANK